MVARLTILAAWLHALATILKETVMPTDPRLAGNAFGITDPVMAQLAAMRVVMADQQRQINDMRAAATIQEVAGTPTSAARNGTPAVDTSAARLWIRRNGAWQFATLT